MAHIHFHFPRGVFPCSLLLPILPPALCWKSSPTCSAPRAQTDAETTDAPSDKFDLVIMIDGWMARDRGKDWGLKPAETQGENVAWREIKTGLVFRLECRGRTQSARPILSEKFVEALCGDPFSFGQRLVALALRHGFLHARRNHEWEFERWNQRAV